MKNIYLILCFITVSISSKAQLQRQYFDGFDTIPNETLLVKIDTTANNIWQIGKPQKMNFDSAATFPNVIITNTIANYGKNTSSSFVITANPTFLYGTLGIRWLQKVDIDTGDYAKIEFSIDTGKTWINALNSPYVYKKMGFSSLNLFLNNNNEMVFNGKQLNWKDTWLCFSLAWLNNFAARDIQIKYTFVSDSIITTNEGWMMDNFWSQFSVAHPLGSASNSIKIKVYPNPTNEKLHIHVPNPDGYSVIESLVLVNTNGVIVESLKNIPTKFYLESNKYQKGNYILKIIL
jgi:hypothetical protein